MKTTITLGFMIFGLLGASVHAKLPVLTEILASGVSQFEAETICKERGERLPTAREFALVAQSLGAQGISETPQAGYYLVNGSDSAGNPDLFYFRYHGYFRPVGDLGYNFFWSSSVDPDVSYNAYVFDGYYGDLVYDIGSIANNRAVRCVRSH